MKISRGKKARAQRVVIYGPEGVGKSSLAAQFPNPIFIDTEGSTDNMDVVRLDKPTSWTMLNNQINFIKSNRVIDLDGKPYAVKTLVIDTIDWAEALAVESICLLHNKKGIEDFGYGNGYVYVKEEIGRFLNKLQDLIEVGINVVLTAHAQIKNFVQPDEMGAYDRYELKLGKKTSSQTAPLVKEWADMVLFCNYKTYVISDDKTKKSKAQGGARVIYTEHHPAWDAKNRHGLPFEIPMDYGQIAHIFNIEKESDNDKQAQSRQSKVQENKQVEQLQFTEKQEGYNKKSLVQPEVKESKPKIEEVFGDIIVEKDFMADMVNPFKEDDKPDYIPQSLWDLMQQDSISESDIKMASVKQGYFPKEMPVANYPQDYLTGYLVPKWTGFKQFLQQIKGQ